MFEGLVNKLRLRGRRVPLDREIHFHIDELTVANLVRGMQPDEARRQALIEFGGGDTVLQQLRDLHGNALLEASRFHAQSAIRFVRRAPSFALAIVATLALGIGANSAVFSAVDAILLHALPFPRASELVQLQQHDSRQNASETFVSTQRLEDWNRLNSTFQAITGYYTGDATLTSGPTPEKATVAFVAPRFLKFWGVQPALGRDFTPQEQTFGGPAAVLISDRFWRLHLHSNPNILGKPLHPGKAAYTIVGVMPASFLFPDRDVDLWEPNPVNAPYAQDRSSTWFRVFGRLKAGVSLSQARADLETVQRDLGRRYPATDHSLSVEPEPLKPIVAHGAQASLWLLYGAVSLLLLIACTNIAALLLARTTEREHELSIRFALGAKRSSLILQLLTEVLALALMGTALGLVLASQASRFLGSFAKDLPRLNEVSLNGRTLAYTLACTFVVTLLCGLLPAIRATRSTLSATLSQAGRTQTSATTSWQWAFVGIQVALAVTLLLASGLLVRSFTTLSHVDAGFEAAHVLTLHISGSWGETANMGTLIERINRTLEGLRAIPGVEAAATSATIPGSSSAYTAEFKLAARTSGAGQKILADAHFVSAGYFAALQIPVLQGSSCPHTSSVPAMVVNRSFARKYFQDAQVLGAHVASVPASSLTPIAAILGIVGDAREQGSETPVQPTVYWCYSAPTPDPVYLIRTRGNPALMAETVRRVIQHLEPHRSVYAMLPLEDHLHDRMAEQRLRTMLLSVFAGAAIALVGLGLYSTISYLARSRRREVGVRLALGAHPGQIAASFVRQGMAVALCGTLAGLLLGAFLGRLFHSLLYGVSPLDPLTYAAVVLFTFLVTVSSTLVPAFQAATVNLTSLLREE